MRIAAVVTGRNEGAEVRATVESLRLSVPDAALDVIVVDDGSTDKSCEGLSCVASAKHEPGKVNVSVLRHEQSQGVGASRNAGAAAALAAGADVVTFHDAHMRFPAGVIEALAAKAVETGAVVCSAARGWWRGPDGKKVAPGLAPVDPDAAIPEDWEIETAFHAWGADLHWNSKDGLQPKYRIYGGKQGAEWQRVPCLMGACYVMSRACIERLTAPTGRLWEDVAGKWGFSEQALAVKAYLLGVETLVARDLATHHLYRKANPVPGAGAENWKNVTFAMAALLSEPVFDLRFRDYSEARLGKAETDRLVKEARNGNVNHVYLAEHAKDAKNGTEVRLFTDLLGRGATIDAPHADHAWLADLERDITALRFTVRSQDDVIPWRVLQWRPGESTLMIRRVLGHVAGTALEWAPKGKPAHRVNNWRPLAKRLGLNLVQCRIEDWSNPVRAGLVKPDDRFDLITIGGEFPDECRRAAESLLAPGGRIVVNPTADRYQVADEYRAHTETAVKEFRAQAADGSPAGGHEAKVLVMPDRSVERSSTQDHSLTVVLLNWKRPENFGPILKCLEGQTARPRVILCDQSADAAAPLQWTNEEGVSVAIEEHPLVDLVVRPSKNLGCMPRWWLAAQADTEFVATLDDDLMFRDERVLEDAMRAQRGLCPDGIVGLFGWRPRPGRAYRDGVHTGGASSDVRVDVIKGRFMLMKRSLLARVPMAADGLVPADLRDALRRSDDVYVSLCVSGGREGAHLVPGVLGKRWRDFKQDGRALASDKGHYDMRDQVLRAVRAALVDAEPTPPTAA